MATPEQERSAINALYRVRAVEKPADIDGTREVWHRAALGVDLFSVLDSEGRLVQQELTMFNDVMHWSRRGGLRSGRVADPSANDPVSGDGVQFDPSVSPERLKRACTAISGYAGDDKYLLHLRELLTASVQGRPWNSQPIISKVADPSPQSNPSPSLSMNDRNKQLLKLTAIALCVMLAGCLVWKLLG